MQEIPERGPTVSDPEREQPAAAGAPAARQAGILVVDDDAFLRSMLHTGLRQAGFAVWVAASGREAVQVYTRQAADIDLVLLDVRMPGLDGPQTLAALQELDAGVRCCFMSGDTGGYSEPELRRPAVLRVFSKPFRLDDVANVLAELVAR